MTDVAPVVVRVRELAPLVARVDPFASDSMPVVVDIVKPLIDVAVAAPSTGVTSVGVLAKTNAPLPVSSDNALEIPEELVSPVKALVPLPKRIPVNVPALLPPEATSILPLESVSYTDASMSPVPDTVCHTGKPPEPATRTCPVVPIGSLSNFPEPFRKNISPVASEPKVSFKPPDSTVPAKLRLPDEFKTGI